MAKLYSRRLVLPTSWSLTGESGLSLKNVEKNERPCSPLNRSPGPRDTVGGILFQPSVADVGHARTVGVGRLDEQVGRANSLRIMHNKAI